MIGIGWDLHRLVPGNKLILGGIEIDSEYGTVAHSDGDVLLHALADALLGAASLGDIGTHFPDTEPGNKGKESSFFILEVMKLIQKKNLAIVNIDSVVILEAPKLLPYKGAIQKKIAGLCKIDEGRVSIKAKTSEKTGPCGRLEAIEAYCVVELRENSQGG